MKNNLLISTSCSIHSTPLKALLKPSSDYDKEMLLPVRVASGPSPPPTAESRRACTSRRTVVRVVSRTSRDGGTARKEKRRPTDDYHATVESLNSRERMVPRKSLGQHYMLNSSINEELVDAADVKEGDVVLEIGPGTGSLTNTLLNSGATVLAVEKDPRMATLIKDRFAGTERLKILQEDITKCHLVSHLAPMLQNQIPGGPQKLAKVVANIPFNVSTEVVKLLLPMGNTFSDVVLLLQDEAAARLTDASVETPEYRSINIFVNFYSDPEYKLQVERTNFFPQPKFDAAIVRFRVKQISEYPPVASPKTFFSMVNSAFNGKRKMLRRSLHYLCSSTEIESALDNIGLPITSRPAELTMNDFVRLHNNLVKQ